MIIHNCQQGSQEWYSARAGVITASQFKLARSRLKSGPRKGQYTEAALDYAFMTAVERIGGQPLNEGFETYHMRRGHELEPLARMSHEAETGLIVTETGFITDDDGIFGASADGLINVSDNFYLESDGGSEYKCFTSPEKVRSFWINDDIGDVMDQVQGGMWLTGRDWWHVGMYCPALEPCGKELWLKEFRRDDEYIEKMVSDLNEFKKVVDDFEEKLRA